MTRPIEIEYAILEIEHAIIDTLIATNDKPALAKLLRGLADDVEGGSYDEDVEATRALREGKLKRIRQGSDRTG